MSDEAEIPTEVVRDLIAIAELVHERRAADGASAVELAKLEAASRAFAACLAIAELAHTGSSVGAAWLWADRGLAWLGEALCKEDASATVFVSAWGTRLGKKRK
ncbi:MAG: hypothetical protein ABJB12_11675 [Pseudomonadota bacterium]